MAVDSLPSPAGRDGSALSGLDALDLPGAAPRPRLAGLWAATWPKLAAVALTLLIWELTVLSGWKPSYVLPGPWAVAKELGSEVTTSTFWHAVATTMRRGLIGFAVATVVGLLIGIAVARFAVLRAAIGSMITGLQTMPSIAWFPLAILLFQISETAILFVVVLGAAPSIANGVISGVDYVPPVLKRAGHNLGARGITLYRHVILPASLPSIVGGLKQGWAFAWRSLMAGELLVIIAERPALGVRLDQFRQQIDAVGVVATMVVILVIGILVDVAFTTVNERIRRLWGVVDGA
ncbi:MAG: sulfonate transport system permease protein [Actinomycetota bacterium]|jgi:NitT/TauT family transport system permease protein|nr:sulfonate transport system permease protein [Actinomycetota bacterium]